MWEQCKSACKIILLIAVVVIAGMVLYYNKKRMEPKKPEGTVEKFALVVEPEYREAIVQIFNKLLVRDPREFEVQQYRDTMTSALDTKKLEDILKGSTEYKSLQTRLERSVDSSEFDKESAQMMSKAYEQNNASESEKNKTKTKSGKGGKSVEPKLDPISESIMKLDLNDRMNLYRVVMKAYESTLFRLPNMKELNYYSYRIQTDKQFTPMTLLKILQSSQEYKILEKNQTNVVNFETPGNVTDAQMTLMVREVYADVFANDLPSKEFETFMKTKLHEYEMDVEKLRKLLKLMKAVDQNNMEAIASFEKESSILIDGDMIKLDGGSSNTRNRNASQQKQDDESQQLDEAFTSPLDQEAPKRKTSKTRNSGGVEQEDADSNDIDMYEYANPSDAQYNSLLKDIEGSSDCVKACNKKKQKARAACKNPYGRAEIQDDEFYAIMQRNRRMNGRICGATANADRDKNMLAEFQKDRNMDELKYSCARNSYFLNADEDLAVSVPPPENEQFNKVENGVRSLDLHEMERLGTPLTEASETKVGSIMPKFVFKEY